MVKKKEWSFGCNSIKGSTINGVVSQNTGDNNTIAQSFGEGAMAAINSSISSVKNNTLQEELKRLSEELKKVEYPQGTSEGKKDDIATELKEFITNASSDNLTDHKKSKVKTLGQNIIKWANTTAKFLKPVAEIVVAVCKVINVVL
jgi:hypothetical protein